jgi:murein DD-endopeptidase MepM/ murein hydrolase activator NlpD
MALDPSHKAARASSSSIVVSIDGRSVSHSFVFSRWGVGLVATLGVLLLAWSVAATAYMAFREDILGGLMARQTRMQYAYEDRIAALRTGIDRLTSRQLVDQDSFEGKVQELLSRQAQLENRQALVASLAARIEGQGRMAAGDAPQAGSAAQPLPLFSGRNQGGPIPPSALGYAPAEPPRPHPVMEPAPLRGSSADAGSALPGARSDAVATVWPEKEFLKSGPVQHQLGAIAAKLAHLDNSQVAALARMESQARKAASRYQSVIAELGLSASRFPSAPAQGGPYVPVRADADAGPFESLLSRVQVSLHESEKLKRVVDALPIRRPLKGELEQTSSFGYRVDPFTRGMALHTGLDLRDEAGSSVRATAAGKVTMAEWYGGYGNLVEIDHGSGIATRYGHLSAILVEDGQQVEVGTIIGRVGSTGRSTGPHLHYETRIDGQPVDPLRYLKMAGRLGPG